MTGRVRATLDLVKFAHTIFALPFALLAMLLAADGLPSLRTIVLILVAMVAARTGAMATNRLADRRYDASNPRTAKRHLVTGALGVRYVTGLAAVSFVVLIAAAAGLNRACLWLSPVAILILVGYSFTKRFTWVSHLFLGLALGGAPLGAWLAVRASLDWPAVALAAAVLLWVAGFDIIYACQDIDHDRRSGLHSIPARFGIDKALKISTVLHMVTAVLLVALPLIAPLGGFYLAGSLMVAGLLWYEHRLVTPRSLSRVNEAFFTINGLVSVALLLCGTLDVLLFGR